MIVVAFYTENTPYEQEIENLRTSCNALGINYHFEGYETRGKWVLNAGIKPEFIWEMLHKFDERLLYIDADAIIREYPILAEEIDCDIAAHIMAGGSLLSGTVIFDNNDRVKSLVNEWVARTRKDPGIWDQKTLHETIVHHGPRLGINFKELPQEYTKIFDKPWGEPIIEHFQASRKLRKLVNESIIKGVPSEVNNQRIRVHVDGSFTISRKNREAETYLDNNFARIKGELRWIKSTNPPMDIELLRDVFKNKKCYLVGKGISLDYISSDVFEDKDVPIIAINEAIHKIEELDLLNPVFCLQQDAGLRNRCLPKKAALIISTNAQHWYAELKNKYIYNPRKLNTIRSHLSVICAIELLKSFDVTTLKMISFDACVNKDTDYAKCIGHPSKRGGDPDRFLKHRRYIDKHTKGMLVDWITPEPAPS